MDIEKGIRTPEKIKEELIMLFDDSLKKIKIEYYEYMLELKKSICEHERIIDSSKSQVADLTIKATDLKRKYETEKKQQYIEWSKKYVSAIIRYEKQIKVSREIIEKFSESIDEAKLEFDLVIAEIAVKRSEFFNYIDNPKVSLGEINVNIEDLTLEFKKRQTIERIERETKEIVSGVKPMNLGDNIDQSEIDGYFQKL